MFFFFGGEIRKILVLFGCYLSKLSVVRQGVPTTYVLVEKYLMKNVSKTNVMI